MILVDNFTPGFRIDLHIKDLVNAMNTGAMMGAPLPLTTGILEVLKQLSAGGNGACDQSGIVKYYEDLAGLKFSE